MRPDHTDAVRLRRIIQPGAPTNSAPPASITLSVQWGCASIGRRPNQLCLFARPAGGVVAWARSQPPPRPIAAVSWSCAPVCDRATVAAYPPHPVLDPLSRSIPPGLPTSIPPDLPTPAPCPFLAPTHSSPRPHHLTHPPHPPPPPPLPPTPRPSTHPSLPHAALRAFRCSASAMGPPRRCCRSAPSISRPARLAASGASTARGRIELKLKGHASGGGNLPRCSIERPHTRWPQPRSREHGVEPARRSCVVVGRGGSVEHACVARSVRGVERAHEHGWSAGLAVCDRQRLLQGRLALATTSTSVPSPRAPAQPPAPRRTAACACRGPTRFPRVSRSLPGMARSSTAPRIWRAGKQRRPVQPTELGACEGKDSNLRRLRDGVDADADEKTDAARDEMSAEEADDATDEGRTTRRRPTRRTTRRGTQRRGPTRRRSETTTPDNTTDEIGDDATSEDAE